MMMMMVPEEGWFGQPKYSTPSKNHSMLCRLLPLFSSMMMMMMMLRLWQMIDLLANDKSQYFAQPRSIIMLVLLKCVSCS